MGKSQVYVTMCSLLLHEKTLLCNVKNVFTEALCQSSDRGEELLKLFILWTMKLLYELRYEAFLKSFNVKGIIQLIFSN